MENLGFTTVTFRQKSRREVCEIAKANGIGFLEWGGDVHVPPTDREALGEALRLQEEFGIKAHSLGSYFKLLETDEAEFSAVLESAAALGAKVIRLWMGTKSSAKTSEAEFNDMVQETKRLAALAAEKDITLAFEFHHNTYNDSGESSLRFLKAVACDNVKTYWQPFTDKTDLDNLRAVLPYLICVHVFSWNKYGVRYPLFWGGRRWKQYIEIIKESGAEPFWIMEFVKGDSEKQFQKDVKTLRQYLSR